MKDIEKTSIVTKVAVGYVGFCFLGRLFQWACGGKIQGFIFFSIINSMAAVVFIVLGLSVLNVMLEIGGNTSYISDLTTSKAYAPGLFIASGICGTVWAAICPVKP
jgi:hypothetical protein